MSNFWMRALTGAVFVIVLVGSIIWRFESFAVLFFIITVLGLWEFYGLAEKDGAKPQKIYGTIAGGILFLCIALPHIPYHTQLSLTAALPLLFIVLIIELYRKHDRPFLNIGYTLLGLLYVALPFGLLGRLPSTVQFQEWLGYSGYSSHITLGFFILMWTSDTGAYLCGRAFGKNKLFERISPKKTWEGAIGGGLLCIGAAYLISTYFKELYSYDWMVMAAIIVIAGNLGDLSESMFKRSINIKDSGNILPGHGGILDRFDAVLIASPFVFTYLTLSRNLVW